MFWHLRPITWPQWIPRPPILIGPHLLGPCTVLHITNQHLSLNSSNICFWWNWTYGWSAPIEWHLCSCVLCFSCCPGHPSPNPWLWDLDIPWWHLDDILMILWQVSTRSQSPPETRANPPVHHGLPAAPAIKACVIKNVITCKEHQGTVRTHVPGAVSNPTTWPHGKWTYLSCRLMIVHILHHFTLEHQKTSKSFSKLLTVEALPFSKPDHLKIQLYVYRLSRAYYPNLLDFEMLCVGYILVCWKLIVFGWWQNSAIPNAEHPRAELSSRFGCLFLK